jgi:hypothetical protein
MSPSHCLDLCSSAFIGGAFDLALPLTHFSQCYCPSKCCRRESPSRTYIDGPRDSHYISHVPARKLQVGQVWKKEDTGDSYLVTKVYNEALTTFAVLRKAGAESERPVKVKVDRKGLAYALPGFSYAQESDEF